jgi:DNA primase
MTWLSEHLPRLTLTEAHEGYFLGRGAKEESISGFAIKTWQALEEDAPDPDFCERYGDKGERLGDWAIWPLFSPRGRVLGFEGRRIPEKKVTRYLLPEAYWQPLWLGMSPEVMRRIWARADVWIVEGLFDLFAMEWVVPDGDVVLASLRAKLTDKHIEFLRRFCKGWVRMVYDNDEAGRHGVHDWFADNGKKRWGALTHLDRVGVRAVAVHYRGKDPGELWNQGGVAGIKAAFS